MTTATRKAWEAWRRAADSCGPLSETQHAANRRYDRIRHLHNRYVALLRADKDAERNTTPSDLRGGWDGPMPEDPHYYPDRGAE